MLYIFLTVVILSGCVPGNTRVDLENARIADKAQKNGDWNTARKHWAIAVTNANPRDVSPQGMAIYNYEYGRALGVTCHFESSEVYLLRAHEIDVKSNGPYFNDLIELARLNLDQKKWDKTIEYYDKVMPELERINAEEDSPHEFANLLDEYAEALEGLNKSEASSYRQKASDIRDKNPKGYSITDRTPYGSQCTN